MNKKLLTAAIAAVIAAPTAALANDVTMYGVAHVSVDWLDSDSDAVDGFDMASRASRLGFMGTEDLANGLKAIWKMEFGVDIADTGSCSVSAGLLGSPTVGQGTQQGVCNSDNPWSTRNAYVGLAGGFGTFLVGRHDTPYKMSTGKLDLFADELGDYNSTLLMTDIRTNSAIAYVSPSWSGFSFAAATVTPHIYYDGVYTDKNGNKIATQSSDSDDLAGAYSLAATFNASGFFATVAYEVLTDDWLNAWAGQQLKAGYLGLTDDTKWRVGLGWTGMGFTVGGVYEDHSDVLGFEDVDKQSWQISAGYTFGNNMVKAMYGQVDIDGGVTGILANDDIESWAIGLDHNLSKRTKAYIQYVDRDYDVIDTGDISGVSIGMVHKF